MRRLVYVALVAWAMAARLPAQTTNADTLFRVFLKDGRALPTYGESAIVGDRVVFSLAIGAGAAMHLQLMSLPSAGVDLDRTIAYARAVRAAYYAATTGESDYRALTADVAKTLDTLASIPDPNQRLQIAESSRQRLLDWSRDHYDFHAADVRTLAEQFEPVIANLRARAGLAQVSLALVAGAAEGPAPILPPPDLRASIEAALAAASAADTEADRQAVLQAAIDATTGVADADDLHADLTRRLAADRHADEAYASLSADLLARSENAVRAADVAGMQALVDELNRRDRELGSLRPALRQRIADALDARLATTRAFRTALDRYATMKPQLLAYERQVRNVLSGIDGLRPVLEAIRTGAPAGVTTTDRTATRLAGLRTSLLAVAAPADVRAIQAALTSVIDLANQACVRHRQVLVARDRVAERDSAAAAAGALLLFDQARHDLVTRLYPPTPKLSQ